MAQFKPQRRSLSAPKVGGGGNPLAQLMLAQNKMLMNQESEKKQDIQKVESLGETAIPVEGTISGIQYKTDESRKFTADAQNQLTRIKQIKDVVKGVQDLGNTLPTDATTAFLKSFAAEKTYGRFGSEQHKTYLDSLPTASAAVYRAITGDNRLSDADAASRAKPLFWDPREPGDVREGKNAFINFLMNEAEQNLTPGEPTDDMESMVRWQSFVNNSKKKFGSPTESSGESDKEKQLAIEAIESGADPVKVKQMYKQRTGMEFE